MWETNLIDYLHYARYVTSLPRVIVKVRARSGIPINYSFMPVHQLYTEQKFSIFLISYIFYYNVMFTSTTCLVLLYEYRHGVISEVVLRLSSSLRKANKERVCFIAMFTFNLKLNYFSNYILDSRCWP